MVLQCHLDYLEKKTNEENPVKLTRGGNQTSTISSTRRLEGRLYQHKTEHLIGRNARYILHFSKTYASSVSKKEQIYVAGIVKKKIRL